MSIDKTQKYRHEYKYLSPNTVLSVIEHRVQSVLSPDKHAGTKGTYSIRSIYFDDMYDTCCRENEDGTDPREKFRIRIYNCGRGRITLELKQKARGKTLKTSCPLSFSDCLEIMAGGIPLITSESALLLKRFVMQMRTRILRPVCIVCYERSPFVCAMGNVRVTFDRNIRSSNDIQSFFDPAIACRPVLPCGVNMLEVKFDEFLPDYISEILQTNTLSFSSFSKYYLCRLYNMKGATEGFYDNI